MFPTDEPGPVAASATETGVTVGPEAQVPQAQALRVTLALGSAVSPALQ